MKLFKLFKKGSQPVEPVEPMYNTGSLIEHLRTHGDTASCKYGKSVTTIGKSVKTRDSHVISSETSEILKSMVEDNELKVDERTINNNVNQPLGVVYMIRYTGGDLYEHYQDYDTSYFTSSDDAHKYLTNMGWSKVVNDDVDDDNYDTVCDDVYESDEYGFFNEAIVDSLVKWSGENE